MTDAVLRDVYRFCDVGYAPEVIVGRTEEIRAVEGFLQAHIDSRSPGAIFLSGNPSSGKSLVANRALARVEAAHRIYRRAGLPGGEELVVHPSGVAFEDTPYSYVRDPLGILPLIVARVNAGNLARPGQVFQIFYRYLFGIKRISADRAQAEIAAYLGISGAPESWEGGAAGGAGGGNAADTGRPRAGRGGRGRRAPEKPAKRAPAASPPPSPPSPRNRGPRGRTPGRQAGRAAGRAAARPAKPPALILLVDEVDQLVTKSQKILYALFDMVSATQKPFILVSIANSLSFCEDNLRLQSRLSRVERCSFRDYSPEDMLEIVRNRLPPAAMAFFPESRIASLLVHRVIAAGGDVRTLLHATAEMYGAAFARLAGAGGAAGAALPAAAEGPAPARGGPGLLTVPGFAITFRDADAVTNPGIPDAKIVERCFSQFDQQVYRAVAEHKCEKVREVAERLEQLVSGVSSLPELRPLGSTHYHEVVRALQRLQDGGFLLLDTTGALGPGTGIVLLN